MTSSGEIDLRMKQLWEEKLPLKIRIFLWMLWHDRILTGEQRQKRKGRGSEKCKYCDKLETRNHLFFNCNIVQVKRVWVRVSLRWGKRPILVTHFQDMIGSVEVMRDNNFAYIILAAVAWSLWKVRNDLVFNNVLIKSPKAINYMIVGFLTQWTKMQKEKNGLLMEDLVLKLKEGLRAW